jgi:hypothetical protein
LLQKRLEIVKIRKLHSTIVFREKEWIALYSRYKQDSFLPAVRKGLLGRIHVRGACQCMREERERMKPIWLWKRSRGLGVRCAGGVVAGVCFTGG